jgi:hypothetical protein
MLSRLVPAGPESRELLSRMRRASLFLVLLFAGCSGDSPVQTSDPRIVVLGNDMGPKLQSVRLIRGNGAVTNARVTVNGTSLTETTPGQYTGQLPGFLLENAAIRIEVIAGADTIIGESVVPVVPRLVAPGNGATIHFPVPLDFSWDDAIDPDAFRGAIVYQNGAEFAEFPGAARAGVVVTSRLPHPAEGITAYLYAYNDGVFSGPAHPASKMRVRQSGGVVSLTLVQ